MRVIVFCPLLLLLFFLKLPIYAQNNASAKDKAVLSHSINTSSTYLLGEPEGPIVCGCGIPCPCPSDNPSEDTYILVERMPLPPGGNTKSYMNTIAKLTRPIEDQYYSSRRTVILGFVIAKTGQLTDFKILGSVSSARDEEAIRVVKSLQPWTPGYQNGQPVRVSYTMLVRFPE